jgi:hypothetical protein
MTVDDGVAQSAWTTGDGAASVFEEVRRAGCSRVPRGGFGSPRVLRQRSRRRRSGEDSTRSFGAARRFCDTPGEYRCTTPHDDGSSPTYATAGPHVQPLARVYETHVRDERAWNVARPGGSCTLAMSPRGVRSRSVPGRHTEVGSSAGGGSAAGCRPRRHRGLTPLRGGPYHPPDEDAPRAIWRPARLRASRGRDKIAPRPAREDPGLSR